jgi:hypothetical protein
MKNVFRLLFSLIAIGLLSQGLSVVLAQDEPESENIVTGLENVQLWVYAEYDDPYEIGNPLLVMLEGQIVGAAPPVEVRFLVPSSAQMYSAGSMDAQGIYSGGPPDRESSGIPGWDVIWYEITSNTFRVEYYDPIIEGDKDKTVSYQFRGLYSISKLTVLVQAPLSASNFEVMPTGEFHTDNLGYDHYIYQFSDLDDDTSLEFNISYSDVGINSLLITGIVVGIIAVFLAVYFWMKRSPSKTRVERRPDTRHTPSYKPKHKRTSPKFCRECGQRLEIPVRFCPNCGANLE